MEDFLQTAAQFANDHWLTLSIGFLFVLFYRYVSMIFYHDPMRYINCSLIFSQCKLSTTLRCHQCVYERCNLVFAGSHARSPSREGA